MELTIHPKFGFGEIIYHRVSENTGIISGIIVHHLEYLEYIIKWQTETSGYHREDELCTKEELEAIRSINL